MLLDVIPPGCRCKRMEQAETHKVIPVLLCGSLVDHSLELCDEQKTALMELKAALAELAGLSMDSLEAARKFRSINEQEKQHVADYVAFLKGLFEKVHKDESLTSPVFLQKFIMVQ